MTPTGAEFITPNEAAEVLAIKVATVHVYIRKGIIPAHRFGDVTRISRAEFYKWLESTRVTPRS
jgi:excisionase family DNA binding protein